jgi:hypothetical protein
MKKCIALMLIIGMFIPVIGQVQFAPKSGIKHNFTLREKAPVNQQVKSDATIDITIIPDNYGSETTWKIINSQNLSVIETGGPYTDGNTNPINVSVTVDSEECYTFIIYDAYSDGICCSYGNGSYTVEYNDVVVGSGGEFDAEDYVYGIGGGCPAHEIALIEITMAEYGTPGDNIPVTGIIINHGVENLEGFDVTYNVDGGSNVDTHTVTGLNLGIGEIYEFTHDIPLNLSQNGNYTINVIVSNPNTFEDNTANNSLFSNLLISDNAVIRTVLLENFTTAVCPNCPPAHDNIENWISGEENIIWLAHHAGYYTDDFTIPENTSLMAFYNAGGSTYAPAIMLDRKFLSPDSDPGPVFFPASTYTPALITQQINTPSFITLNIDGNIDTATNMVNIDLSGTFHADFLDDLRIGLYIMENGLEGTQSGASGTYIHDHVMRDAISSTFGDDEFENTLTDDNFSIEYQYTLDETWNTENCVLVAWVSKWDSGNINNREILQSAKKDISALSIHNSILSFGDVNVSIFPNPASNQLTIENAESSEILIYNQIGQLVYNQTINDYSHHINTSSLSEGNYIIKLIFNDSLATQKFVIVR